MDTGFRRDDGDEFSGWRRLSFPNGGDKLPDDGDEFTDESVERRGMTVMIDRTTADFARFNALGSR